MTINNNTAFSTDSPIITYVKSGSNGLHSELSNLNNQKIDFETYSLNNSLNYRINSINNPNFLTPFYQNSHHGSNTSNSAQTLASSDSFISENFSRHNYSSHSTTPELHQIKDITRSQEYNSKKKKRFSDGSFLSNGLQWLTKHRRNSAIRDRGMHSYNYNNAFENYRSFSLSETLPSTSHKSMPIIPLSPESIQTLSNLGGTSSTTVNSFNTRHSSPDDYKKRSYTIDLSDLQNSTGKYQSYKSNDNTLAKIPNQKCKKRLSTIFKKSKKQHPLLTSAIQALESMRYNDAINLYSQVLIKYPNSYSIRCDRAYASYQVEDWERALSDLDFAILKKPKKPRAYTLRGEIYRLLESYKESLMDFNQSLKLQPKNIHALRARAEVFYSINHYNEAILDLNFSLELEPNNIFTLSRRAKVYCSLGFYGAALLDLNKALEIDGSHAASILANRGEVYHAIGRNDLALLDLNDAIIRGENGENILALERRGHIYRSLGREEDALNDFEKILQFNPRSFIAHKNIGEILYSMGEYEDALVHMNISLQLHSSNNEISLIKYRAEIYQKLEYYEEAITDYNLIITLKPDDLDTIKSRALLDLDRAIENIRDKAFNLEHSTIALYNRGAVYSTLGKYAEALLDLNRVLFREPHNLPALCERSVIYEALGRTDKALTDIDHILKIDHSNEHAIALMKKLKNGQ
ncbi:6130_t:CDS:2 [Gigaspora margarita]|uniref:6130_t:CDS:1 n=1 Tax=Gigaspora margarita TaxID=4874 RepID=A0ABN7UGY3_GIGMA|nr:6130_t:CDS:2 [Gigaspora margarita]